MSTCLCKTTYGKFVTTKTYEWRELQQGTAWAQVVEDYERWASTIDSQAAKSPSLNRNDDKSYTVTCDYGAGLGSSNKQQVLCTLYDTRKTTIKFSLSPEPYKSKPKNVQTPPDQDGSESGPYSPPDDPPGDKWDQSPPSWEPTQTVNGCDCTDTTGGEVFERDCEPVTWKEPYINFHTEKVKPVFTATFNTTWKYGWDVNCCPNARNISPRVTETNIPVSPIVYNDYPEIELPFGLFEGEKICLLKYLNRHVCL